MYTRPAIDIFREIVEGMTFPIKILSVTVEDDLQTVEVCDIYHAEPLRELIIDGNTYLIKDIVESSFDECGVATNPKLILQGAPEITAKTFDLYKPLFFHGTPRATNTDLEKTSNIAQDKTPFGWFLEQYKEYYYPDTSSLERDINFSLFFLTIADHSKWLTKDAYHNAINPMKRLAENFISDIKTMIGTFIVTEIDYDMIYYSKFGAYIVNAGTEKNLFHDELAGVEIRFSKLTLRRNYTCKRCA